MGASLQRARSQGVVLPAYGWTSPPFCPQIASALTEVIQGRLDLAATSPSKRQTHPQPRWTLKRLLVWLKEQLGLSGCRETLRKVLKRQGFSWKKARKLLNKANTKARATFLEKLKNMLDEATHGERMIVYLDEAHIHLDTDEGYGWSVKGQRFWVNSSSPGLAKVSFYSVYLYNQEMVRIFPYDRANTLNTVEVLNAIRAQFLSSNLTVIWDNVSYQNNWGQK